MDERIFRYGDVLVDIMMISDPQYLSRPFIYSKMYAYIPQGNMDPYPCSVHNQVPTPEGYVPMRLPFYTTNYNDLFAAKGIPPESILPRVNVLTFWAWKALGRSVRNGEHGVRVRSSSRLRTAKSSPRADSNGARS